MEEPLRFIHTADLHLDSPFKGMSGLPKEYWKRLRDSTFHAFDRLIAYAHETRPDFVLIAGDIYDGEDRSIRAQHRFRAGMEQLAELNIPVFLSYGNHDHLSGSWTRFELPSNVHVFGASVEQAELTVRETAVRITGFSYPNRHVSEPMIQHFPVAEDPSVIHIGMLHGSMEGDTAHAVYAPFRKEQLLLKNYDYWALGHIHRRQILHEEPFIVYPGNLQGRHRKEQGEKGFYDVTLTKTGSHLDFIPAASVRFAVIEVPCEGIRHMNELLTACSEAVIQFQEMAGEGVAELVLSNSDASAEELLQDVPYEELLEAVREAAENGGPPVWIDRLTVSREEEPAAVSPLAASVINLLEGWDSEDWKEVLKDVYRHVRGSRYLEPLGDEELTEIRREAADKIKRALQAEA